MANNNDYQDKFKGNLTGAMGKAFSTGARLSAKVATKGASLAVKGLLKVIKKIVTAVASTGVAFIVIILVICSMLSALVIGTAIDMTSDTNVEQEAPELTKAYLNTYKDEFAEKIYELIQDERFNSYILNGEFDNAYTKLIYGGTNAYSQKELKGYANADEADASWVKYTEDGKEINTKITGLNKLIVDINNNTNKEIKKILKEEIDKDDNTYNIDSSILEDVYDIYNEKGKNKKNKALNIAEDELNDANDELKDLCDDNKYAKATPLLQKLQQYKDKGLSDDKILINDDYLRGYGKASGYSVDDNGKATDTGETMAFNKWINNSYYVIPYYYHVNMARNSEYKNKLGGTLTDSMNLYSNLTAMFGAGIIEDVGKVVLAKGVVDRYVNNKTYGTYKKMCDAFLNVCKSKEKRKKLAKEIINQKQKQENIKSDTEIKGGVNIYAYGLSLKINSIAMLLKNMGENPELQIGVPNWNVDTGDWQFMLSETKDVKKYPSKFNSLKQFGGSTYRKEKYKNNLPIWNNQTSLKAYMEEGFGQHFTGTSFSNFFMGKNSVFEGNELYEKKYAKYNTESYTNMSYKDILNTGFTNLWLKGGVKRSNNGMWNLYKLDYSSAWPAQGVMLGYKQEVVNSSTESMLNEMAGFDGLYNYYAFSKYANTHLSIYDSTMLDVVTSNEFASETTSDYKDIIGQFTKNNEDKTLYIYDWEDYKTKCGTKKNKHSNYYNYLRKVNNVNTVSKREDEKKKSINNELLVKLRNQFASYFINQIYYTYSDNIHDSEKNNTSTGGGSDYIRDFFLSETATKTQKIAFLQRSFNAMASGSSFTYTAKEKYDIKNGRVISELNGSTVGNIDLESKIEVNKISKISTNTARVTSSKTENKGDTRGHGQGSATYYNIEKDDEPGPWYNSKTYAGYIGSLGPTPFVFKNPSNSQTIKRLKENIFYGEKSKDLVKLNKFNTKGFDRQEYVVTYDANIKLKKPNSSKWTDTKATIEFTYKRNGNNLVTPKYKIIVSNAEKKFEKIFNKNVKWNDDFYQEHKEDLDNGNYNFTVNMDKTYSTSIMRKESITSKDISCETVAKQINGEMDGKYPLQATMEGERDIVMDYNTAGFLTYEIQEDKDANNNVIGVTAGVYIKFPTEDMETRLAYMWEKDGMLENSLKLLDIYDKQKNLDGADSKVDLNELIINYDATQSAGDIDDTKNPSLPEMISNEMIEAAFKIQKDNGVPVSSTFGQIITESRGKYGKGLSLLAYKYHNLVGMKSPSSGVNPVTHKKYQSGKVNMGTKEESKGGTKYSTNAWFATYKTDTDCILDRGDLLTNLKRPYAVKTRPYLNKNVQKYTVKMARKFVWAVGEVGYATASDYYTLVTGVMDEYNLYQYDNMTIEDYKSQFSGDGDVEGGGETIESVLQAAYSQAGKRYQSPPSSRYNGGKIPSTFDCSSLVHFAFKRACNIEVGQSTKDQPGRLRSYKKQVKTRSFWVEEISTKNFSVSKLQRGDLVYLQGHVEFYVGGNRQFDASMHYSNYTMKTNKNGKKYKYWTRDIAERKFSVSQGLVAIFRFHFKDDNSGIAQKILKAAYTVPSPGSGLCAKWVRQVYQKAKVKIYPQEGAIQYWTNRKKMKGYTYSTNIHSVPVGALVIGHGSGPMGKKYGHIGIYMGNNMVISNVGNIKTETMSSFNNWQKGNCSGASCKFHSKKQGLVGWIAPQSLVNVRAGITIPSNVKQTGIINDYTHYETQNWVQPCLKVFNAWKRKGRKESRRNATIDGYYLVATRSTFGAIGDRINIILSDNTVIKAIQADAKGNESHSKWGHIKPSGGTSIVEFEYLNVKYGRGKGINLKGWAGKKVKRIENLGKYIR